MTVITEIAKAKVNLDLRVCRRREDGYHDLDSLVVFTDLGDQLSFRPADGFTLSIEGAFAGQLLGERDNLVERAANRLGAWFDRAPNVHVTLEKNLPIAAGIGGGSADAAATLRGLCRFWNVPATMSDLVALAEKIGADVPVCLGGRAARMTGIGDKLAPFDLPAPMPMLLVNPGVALATPPVFKLLDQMSGGREGALPLESDAAFLEALVGSVNDLESPARQLAPEIDQVLNGLVSLSGCRLARMSGSGATCFGVFEDECSLASAAERLAVDHPDWWTATTLCR